MVFIYLYIYFPRTCQCPDNEMLQQLGLPWECNARACHTRLFSTNFLEGQDTIVCIFMWFWDNHRRQSYTVVINRWNNRCRSNDFAIMIIIITLRYRYYRCYCEYYHLYYRCHYHYHDPYHHRYHLTPAPHPPTPGRSCARQRSTCGWSQ